MSTSYTLQHLMKILTIIGVCVGNLSSQMSEAEPNDQREFFAENVRLGDISSDSDKILYEAARSGEFDIVQITSTWAEITPDKSTALKTSTYLLKSVENFDSCAEASLPKFGRFENFSRTESTEPLLFQPTRYDHELLSGKCVVGYPIEGPTAAVKLSIDQFHYVVEGVDEADEFLRSKSMDDVWQAFGLSRPIGYDLWALDGSKRQPDSVSDSDLIRAINHGGEMQRAALNILTERMRRVSVPDDNGNFKTEIVRQPPTSEEVVSALLESEMLTDICTWWDATRVFIAIGPNSQADQIMDQLFAGLETPIPDNRRKVDKTWQEKVESELGEGLFDKPQGKSAYENWRHLNLALELALVLGGDYPVQLVERYESKIRSMLLNELIVKPDLIRTAAKSKFRDQITLELLAKVENDQKTPPIIQSRIKLLLTDGKPLSDELQDMIEAKCKRPNSLFPTGNQERAQELCDQLLSGNDP